MKAAAAAFSDRGERCAAAIAAALGALGFEAEASRCPAGGLDGWVSERFYDCQALVFVSSAGIAVRAVAPYIKSKLSDPAVLVADEGGSWLIPILSGHIGGANELAEKLAPMIGARAVITTATDINGLFSPDLWARKNGFAIAEPKRIKDVSAKLLAGQRIKVKSDLPLEISPGLSRQLERSEEGCDLLISMRAQPPGTLRLIPRRLVIGTGCRRGTPAESFERAFLEVCARLGIDGRALCAVCSADLKSDERGLLEFCENHGAAPLFFSAEQLAEQRGDFSASGFVRDTVGADNVCERAAIAAGGKSLLLKKSVFDGVTMAAALLDDGAPIYID